MKPTRVFGPLVSQRPQPCDIGYGAAMSNSIPLCCSCGKLRGTLCNASPSGGNRIICMCDDCQAFAHFLGAGETVLDANGGTDIFQTTPSQVGLTEGIEHLSCMRMSPSGTLRWYAGCCKTPIANTTAKPGVPFVGLIHKFVDHEEDGQSRDERLGPPLARIMGRYGHGQLAANAHVKLPVGLLFRSAWFILGAKLSGKTKPTPFFDAARKPSVEPMVVSKDERKTLLGLASKGPHS